MIEEETKEKNKKYIQFYMDKEYKKLYKRLIY